ncbi:hypothetical protein IFM89_013024 [Coptis chinensis]|uniref:Uncharacterized protein n=1 Tax=Coptis chinensis TaxID=261450 RepID=A0A835GVY4_9MAGN|nr:hypothetical protein IFM89_013024 [Coptis chinensis]
MKKGIAKKKVGTEKKLKPTTIVGKAPGGPEASDGREEKEKSQAEGIEEPMVTIDNLEEEKEETEQNLSMDVLCESQQLMLNKSVVEASVKRTTLIEEEGEDESETEDSGEDEFESPPPPKRARVVLRPSKKGEAKGSLNNKPAEVKVVVASKKKQAAVPRLPPVKKKVEPAEVVAALKKKSGALKKKPTEVKVGSSPLSKGTKRRVSFEDCQTETAQNLNEPESLTTPYASLREFSERDADLHWGQRHLLPLLDDGIMEGLTPNDYVNDDIVSGSQPNPTCHMHKDFLNKNHSRQREAEKNEAFKDMDITGEDALNIPNMVTVSGERDEMVEGDVVQHSVNEDAGKPMDDDVQLDVDDDAGNTNNGILEEISPKVMVSGERDEMVEDDVVRHSINEDAGKPMYDDAGKTVEDDVQLDVDDDVGNTNGRILKEISPKSAHGKDIMLDAESSTVVLDDAKDLGSLYHFEDVTVIGREDEDCYLTDDEGVGGNSADMVRRSAGTVDKSNIPQLENDVSGICQQKILMVFNQGLGLLERQSGIASRKKLPNGYLKLTTTAQRVTYYWRLHDQDETSPVQTVRWYDNRDDINLGTFYTLYNNGWLNDLVVDMYIELLHRWYIDKDGPGGHEPKYSIVSASFFSVMYRTLLFEYVLMGSSGRELDFNDNVDSTGKTHGQP